MNPDDFPERERYHQLHPAKLLVDSSTAIAGGVLFWRRQPLAALAAGFVPAIAVTLVFLSGGSTGVSKRSDAGPSHVRSRPRCPRTSTPFASAASPWRGPGADSAGAWPIPAGLLVIVAGWWLAWRRSNVS
jgi:hypothetical protein